MLSDLGARPLVLRPVGEADSRRLWEWRNDPEVRRWSFRSAPVRWEEHVEWFRDRRLDPACHIYIAELPRDTPVGQVRFQVERDGVAEVHVVVAPDQRAKGYAAPLLRQACERIWRIAGVRIVRARIKLGNTASIRAFARAGFVATAVDGDTTEMVLSVQPQPGRPLRILFAPAAGRRVGMGHWRRSLSLALAARAAGADCALRVGRSTVVDVADANAITIEGGIDARGADIGDELESLVRDQALNVVVVDSYGFRAADFASLRDVGVAVVAIDDLCRHPFPCHLVVNGGIDAERLEYRSSSGDTVFLLGPAYALLTEDFAGLPRRSVSEKVRTILVTVGGGDVPAATAVLLAGLDHARGNFSVIVVVGPLASNRHMVERTAETCRRDVRVIVAPHSVRDLMLEADLAVSAAGQTLYELAATGTPAVAFQAADNQGRNLGGFERLGIVHRLSLSSARKTARAIARAVEDLAEDPERRARMSTAAQGLVDGHGASRVASTVVEFTGCVAASRMEC